MTYEIALETLVSLKPSSSDEVRDVTWLGTSQTVGVSRTSKGGIEIFLAGAPLHSIYPSLARSLVHGPWHRSGGQPPVEANRLQLPSAGHFAQVAALICTELLRNGADDDLPRAFQRSEALINHSVEGLSMNAQALVGLKGELVLLQALLQSPSSHDVTQLIGTWHGWRRSTRDFALGPTGVEVKTTTEPTVTHKIQGIHQVEVSTPPGDEERLLLVSVGIERTTPDNASAFTLPRTVDTILDRVRHLLPPAEADKVCTEFLVHLQDYGSEYGISYDHTTMHEDPSFAQPFALQWVRAYDMGDPAVKVLRSSTVSTFVHVEPGSVSYSVQLPPQIAGDTNPVNGLAAVAAAILDGPGPG
ncbi:PD-(D/E)XK motif protein [Aeromicrobium sp.]|uniref:PD-(D/E)XK motif protein n=1 Tax=Aeromicrobium sp. TaxID=1871063 RepID=UPI0019B4712F|nr:PD-(D/E)XK motif protein [Aeromicrobium sp.]MBC7630557.1 PD-(D/E)XK motif protein [Aeromicrobium sp.]